MTFVIEVNGKRKVVSSVNIQYTVHSTHYMHVLYRKHALLLEGRMMTVTILNANDKFKPSEYSEYQRIDSFDKKAKRRK